MRLETQEPTVGSRAPEFDLPNQHGERVRSSQLGGRPAVLVFYPGAFTSVCTGEMRALQEHLEQFSGATVAALSTDPMFSLRTFADTYGLTFDLLSDFWPHGATASAFGVFDDELGCARRASFLLDPDGIVTWSVVNAIGEARDVAEHLAALAQLRPVAAP